MQQKRRKLTIFTPKVLEGVDNLPTKSVVGAFHILGQTGIRVLDIDGKIVVGRADSAL